MNNSEKQNKRNIADKNSPETKTKEIKNTAEETILTSLYEHSMKEAENLKVLFILYMTAFILFAVITIAFAATLYAYPAHHFTSPDGHTLWGAVILKLLIFVPLAFLLWFFASQTRKIRISYEIVSARSFVLKFAEDMLESTDKKTFIKDFLKDFAIKSISNHKIITS